MITILDSSNNYPGTWKMTFQSKLCYVGVLILNQDRLSPNKVGNDNEVKQNCFVFKYSYDSPSLHSASKKCYL